MAKFGSHDMKFGRTTQIEAFQFVSFDINTVARHKIGLYDTKFVFRVNMYLLRATYCVGFGMTLDDPSLKSICVTRCFSFENHSLF
jgi:hypothetical protein